MEKDIMKKIILFLTVTCLIWSVAGAQTEKASGQADKFPTELDQVIPLDPNITCGKLDNGVTYYINVNRKPEKRVELRLAVNAGSVLEDDDQQGLAHFTEHMAFNGTKNFKKQELVNYLESIGMRFGPDLNAYTSFDETVYMLQVPTDSTPLVETAFQILEDWAHQFTLEDAEIDKERGVIIEEWRLGRGAEARMSDKQFPIILKGSRYADRLPIGKKEIIESFDYETLKRFYREWYRADLIAVVAIGDFEKDWMESLIKKYFSRLPKPENPRKREIYPVPDHKETLFAIATDPEATRTEVSLNYKHPLEITRTVADYRDDIINNIYNSMFNQRLYELTVQPNPPFISAYSYKVRYLRSKDIYSLEAMVEENGIEKGLKTLLVEAERVKRFGFTEPELERQKKESLRRIEQMYNERDKTESRRLVRECVSHFLNGEVAPGIEYEYELYKRYLPTITLEEVNRLAGELIIPENRVITVSAPEKPELKIPEETELLAIFDVVAQENIAPYQEEVSDVPLVQTPPQPTKVIAEYQLEPLGLTVWMLGNGVEVYLKPTDFKNDEILMRAFSPGGFSLVDMDELIPATTAANIIREGGVGNFNQIQLGKKLAGKMVRVSTEIYDLREELMGNASPEDLETMMQLIYLYFTAPRKDNSAFLAYKDRLKVYVENRSSNPEAVFYDSVNAVLTQHHPWSQPWSLATIEKMDLDKSFDIYKERFADASDFTFVLVGNLELEKIRPLVETYLGGLPSLRREENSRDVGIRPPKGVVAGEVHKGLEPKSRVMLIFTGDFEWNRLNRYEINTMASAFRIKLREVIREDMGGTYGIGVNANVKELPNHAYSINIGFGCDPERVEELTGMIITQIDSLKTYGLSETYVEKVKEMQRRERETAVKENRFWLMNLSQILEYDEDPMDILEYDKLIAGLTVNSIQTAARKYFNTENYVRMVLLPEKQ